MAIETDEELPKPVETPDWAEVLELCVEYLTEVADGKSTDSDMDHYIFEAVIKAVYGPDIFEEWINPRLMRNES